MSDSKPKKGGFFKKPDWLAEKAKNQDKPDEKKDATQLFARSTGTVSDVLAEQKRKEQLRAEKKARASQKEAESPKAKRRRLSDEEDYIPVDRDAKKDSISPRRIISTRQLADTSPQSSSKRYHTVLTTEQTKKKHTDVIELSDNDSSSDSTPTPKPTRANGNTLRTSTEHDELQKEDEDEEFPELAAAARARVRQQEQEKKTSRATNSTNGFDTHDLQSSKIADTGPNPVIDILVYSQIEGTAPLLVKRKWNQNFRDIRKAWIQRQTNLTETVKKDIYFTWREKKVFDVGSCKSIGIKLDQFGNAQIPSDQGPYKDSDDRVVLCATTDTQARAEKEARDREKREEQENEEEPHGTPAQAPPSDQIKIILKAKGYTDQKLIVKPDTKVERLEGAFRKHHHVLEDKTVVLMFDGEDLQPNMTMEDIEIEDMNMVEVYVR